MFDNRKLGKNQQQDSGIKAGQEMPLGQKGKQQQYVKRQKKTVFYASVIVRSNEELAEKLLAEQESFFE